MKKIALMLMAVFVVFSVAFVNFTFGDMRKDKVDVVKFVNICKANCYRQFAYVFKEGSKGAPDLVVILVYNHKRGERVATHEVKDTYGILAISKKTSKEVWGGVLDGGVEFKKIFEPFSYDFRFFFAGSRIERIGDYKDFEKEIFENFKNWFGEEGNTPSVIERKLI